MGHAGRLRFPLLLVSLVKHYVSARASLAESSSSEVRWFSLKDGVAVLQTPRGPPSPCLGEPARVSIPTCGAVRVSSEQQNHYDGDRRLILD